MGDLLIVAGSPEEQLCDESVQPDKTPLMFTPLKTKAFQKLMQKARLLTIPYRNRKDILDIQIGFKEVANELTPKLSIRFVVHQKIAAQKLPAQYRIPKQIGDFDTDVVVQKKERQLMRQVDPADIVRPLIGGVQIQSTIFNNHIGWGTLGCILQNGNQTFALTNYHVAFNNLTPQQAATQWSSLRLIQPSQSMGGQDVGRHTPIFDQELDYALIELNIAADQTQSLNNIPGLIGAPALPTPGMVLGKTGAATGFTLGRIVAASTRRAEFEISYNSDPANESNLISDYGDSGSIWAYAEGNIIHPVGLHFGGDTSANKAFARSFNSVIRSIKSKL